MKLARFNQGGIKRIRALKKALKKTNIKNRGLDTLFWFIADC